MICEVCGSEMHEAICAGQPWWVCNECGNWEEAAPKTNYERIKGMTVDEMTAFLTAANAEHCDFPCKVCSKTNDYCKGNCTNAVRGWLNSPVEAWVG